MSRKIFVFGLCTSLLMGMLFVAPVYEAEGEDEHTVIQIGPEERTAELRIPGGYNPEEGLLPLVVALHGYGEYPEYITGYFETQDSVHENGHLLLTPKGTENPDDDWFWNGTDACCDFYDQKPDDVGWLTGLIDEAVEDYGVDSERVMLIGHSNGGFMSHRMACDAGNYLHTIVNFAGSTYDEFDECAETGYPNIINVHGTDDNVIYYNGGSIGSNSYPSAPQSTSFWAERSGCEEERTFIRNLNLVNNDEVNETEDLEHLNCAKGNRVTLWKVNDEAHMPNFYNASLINASFEWAFSDTDGDGVKDIDDQCPDTVEGAEVDENGCVLVEIITVDVAIIDVPPHPEWEWNYSYQVEVDNLQGDTNYTAIIIVHEPINDEWGGLDWWWDTGDSVGFWKAISLQRGCYHINVNLYESGALHSDEENATILAFDWLNFTVGNGTCINGVYSENEMIEIDDSDNDGVEDVDDRCPDTVEGSEVDEDGCAASCCILDESDERRWIPGFGIFTTMIAVALAIGKFKRRY